MKGVPFVNRRYTKKVPFQKLGRGGALSVSNFAEYSISGDAGLVYEDIRKGYLFSQTWFTKRLRGCTSHLLENIYSTLFLLS